jgi:two-component system chemotaxis response regulator CheB
MAGTVVVQHMPPVFTKIFAARLNALAKVEVKEAESGDRIHTGRVLIAPGDRHMEVVRSGGMYNVRCMEGKEVNGHCPSVDVLFRSAAREVGTNGLGVLLTGMGRDGADGLLEMKQAGARTLAQDEESCIVFGMPKAAVENGAAEKLVSLQGIPRAMFDILRAMK